MLNGALVADRTTLVISILMSASAGSPAKSIDVLARWQITFCGIILRFIQSFIELSAMDVLAPTTMKDAAKCDNQCELQNSVNQSESERIRHCSLSTVVSVSVSFSISLNNTCIVRNESEVLLVQESGSRSVLQLLQSKHI